MPKGVIFYKALKIFFGHNPKLPYGRSVLCLNGQVDFDLVRCFQTEGLPIIAADGMGNVLLSRKIVPSRIVGDMDSFRWDSLYDKKNLVISSCQNTTDFEKSLTFLRQNSGWPPIILGVSGGRLDHILNNIGIFSCQEGFFCAPPIIGWAMSSGAHTLFIKSLYTKISLFPMPMASVKTTGLKWDLNQEKLSFPHKMSVLNRTVEKEVTLVVEEGKILVMIYLLSEKDKGFGP